MEELQNITTQELREELEKREKEAAKKVRPCIKTFPLTDSLHQPYVFAKGLESLMNICGEYLTEVEKGESEDSDTPHFIFETALECVYGKEVWEWIREMQK